MSLYRYRKNAKYVSTILQNNARSPREIAADWIEYIIANKGAKYLRVEAYNQTFVQYYLIDVLLVYIIAITIMVYVLKKVLRLICRQCCKS